MKWKRSRGSKQFEGQEVFKRGKGGEADGGESARLCDEVGVGTRDYI